MFCFRLRACIFRFKVNKSASTHYVIGFMAGVGSRPSV